MQNAGLNFVREKEMPVFYKQQQIGTRRADFLVEDVVSVELKAIITLENVHLSQAKNYLEAYSIEVGLLINFGSKSMEFKRLTNNNFKKILYRRDDFKHPFQIKEMCWFMDSIYGKDNPNNLRIGAHIFRMSYDDYLLIVEQNKKWEAMW